MKIEKIFDLIREEIQSYQDVNAPERMALAHLITRIEKADSSSVHNANKEEANDK